jgi:hypothetical protein
MWTVGPRSNGCSFCPLGGAPCGRICNILSRSIEIHSGILQSRRGTQFAALRGMPEISRFDGIVIRMFAEAGASLNAPNDLWKVRLIGEDFPRLMFEMERA